MAFDLKLYYGVTKNQTTHKINMKGNEIEEPYRGLHQTSHMPMATQILEKL